MRNLYIYYKLLISDLAINQYYVMLCYVKVMQFKLKTNLIFFSNICQNYLNSQNKMQKEYFADIFYPVKKLTQKLIFINRCLKNIYFSFDVQNVLDIYRMTEVKNTKQKKQTNRSQKSRSKGSRSKLENINRQKITAKDIYEDLQQTKQKINRVPLPKPEPFQFSMSVLQNKINEQKNQVLNLKHRVNAYLLDLISQNSNNDQEETNQSLIIDNARNCTPSQLLSSLNKEIKNQKQNKSQDKGKGKTSKRKFKGSSSIKKLRVQPYDDPTQQAKIKLQIQRLNHFQQMHAQKRQEYEQVVQEDGNRDDKQKGQKQSSNSVLRKKSKIIRMPISWEYENRHLKQRRLQIKSRFRNPQNDDVDQSELTQWQSDMKQVFKKLLGQKFNNYWIDIKQQKKESQQYYHKKQIKKEQQNTQKVTSKRQEEEPSFQMLERKQIQQVSFEHKQNNNYYSIFNDQVNQPDQDDFLAVIPPRIKFNDEEDDYYGFNSFFNQNNSSF